MNDRLLKKLILKEIHSVLKEGESMQSGKYKGNLKQDLVQIQNLLNDVPDMIKHKEYDDAIESVKGAIRLVENTSDLWQADDEDEDY